MKSKKLQCPKCKGERDYRAQMCAKCNMKFKHPRLGTGKDWHLHERTGYLTKCISGKWTYKHRYIMEAHLGRRLESYEHVHHIDGNKTNNDLSNLEILHKSDHHRLHIEGREKEMSMLGHEARWGYVPDL